MVQALITLDEHANQILNIVKAEFGLNDKSEAVNLVVKQYEEELMEPELRPEFVARIKKIEKHGKFKSYDSFEKFKADIENA